MKVLLDKTVHLSAKDDRNNVIIPFCVDQKFDALKIECEYSPKYIEDETEIVKAVNDCFQRYLLEEDRPEQIDPKEYTLNNLVTISIDCNEEYLGAAHRQANKQTHIISASFSSPGFYKHAIDEGEWRIVLSVHALASGEVTYRLKVSGEENADI